MTNKKIICTIGSLVLLAGVFAPIVGLGALGNIDHFQNGEGDGVLVFGLAILSLLLGLFGRYRWLWLTGPGSLAITCFTFYNLQSGIAQAQTDTEGNPFLMLAEFKWGWIPLVLGSVLIIVSAALKNQKQEAKAETLNND